MHVPTNQAGLERAASLVSAEAKLMQHVEEESEDADRNEGQTVAPNHGGHDHAEQQALRVGWNQLGDPPFKQPFWRMLGTESGNAREVGPVA